MEDKIQSAIKSIALDGCTYHNITVTPTLINFFFGKNGLGKSTIAQQIIGSSGVVPAMYHYDIYIYDRDFINRNIQENTRMLSVFSVSEGNIKKQKDSDAKETQLNDLGTKYMEKKYKHDDKSKRPTFLFSTLDAGCKTTTTFRTNMLLTMKNEHGSKSAFVDELMSITNPKKCVVSELKTLYSTAFDSDTSIYQKLTPIKPIAIEGMAEFDLLA